MPKLKASSSEIQKHLVLLEENIKRMAACTAKVDAMRLASSSSKREWSAVEILGHLRACDDLWSYSIYAMLTDQQPSLALIDERRWTKMLGYANLNFHQSFEVFAAKRTELIAVLKSLSEEAWSRTALIEGRQHSVFSQVRRLALHEREHCNQIESLLSRDSALNEANHLQ